MVQNSPSWVFIHQPTSFLNWRLPVVSEINKNTLKIEANRTQCESNWLEWELSVVAADKLKGGPEWYVTWYSTASALLSLKKNKVINKWSNLYKYIQAQMSFNGKKYIFMVTKISFPLKENNFSYKNENTVYWQINTLPIKCLCF